MLALAVALFLVGVVALATVRGRSDVRNGVQAVSTDTAYPAAWRAAALGANADAKDLRLAIATALDERDARRRDQVLREALVKTSGPVPVRVTL